MKREYAELFVAIVLIIISAFPLFDILSNMDSTINVSAFSLAIIVIMLIVVLFSSIIYFISYWTDKFNQLHFKGAVYTVPEIYQVRGLHNSSSLYKITSWRASYFVIVTDVLTVSKVDVKHNTKLPFGLVAQRLEQQTHNLEVLGSNPSWSTIYNYQESKRRYDSYWCSCRWWWSMVKSQGHTRIFSPNSIHQLSWQSNRFLIYGSWVRVPYVSQQMIP